MTIDPITMNGLFAAEYFDLESTAVGDSFRVFVAKPEILEPGRKYPVIFALDGNVSFASLMGTQRMLAQGAEVPSAFVVGVGYPGATVREAMVNRNRDYVPSEPGQAEAMALGTPAQPGAKNFLRFLLDELTPTLQAYYPVDPTNSTMVGISLGGLFGAWVLLTEPESFARYILGSPAIWWRGQQAWEWEEEYSRGHNDLPANVFIAAGAHESREYLRKDALAIAEKRPELRDHIEKMVAWSDQNGWPEVANLVPKLAERLHSRAYPGLNLHHMIFPDENHMSVHPFISSRGLRYVFGSWRP